VRGASESAKWAAAARVFVSRNANEVATWRDLQVHPTYSTVCVYSLKVRETCTSTRNRHHFGKRERRIHDATGDPARVLPLRRVMGADAAAGGAHVFYRLPWTPLGEDDADDDADETTASAATAAGDVGGRSSSCLVSSSSSSSSSRTRPPAASSDPSAVSEWLLRRGKATRPAIAREKRAELAHYFETIDEDNSGAISTDELAGAFEVLGVRASRAKIEEMMTQVDEDGSGEVEFPEFLTLMTTRLGADHGATGGGERIARRRDRLRSEILDAKRRGGGAKTGTWGGGGGAATQREVDRIASGMKDEDGFGYHREREGGGGGGGGGGEEEEEEEDALLPFALFMLAFHRRKLMEKVTENVRGARLEVIQRAEDLAKTTAAERKAAEAELRKKVLDQRAASKFMPRGDDLMSREEHAVADMARKMRRENRRRGMAFTDGLLADRELDERGFPVDAEATGLGFNLGDRDGDGDERNARGWGKARRAVVKATTSRRLESEARRARARLELCRRLGVTPTNRDGEAAARATLNDRARRVGARRRADLSAALAKEEEGGGGAVVDASAPPRTTTTTAASSLGVDLLEDGDGVRVARAVAAAATIRRRDRAEERGGRGSSSTIAPPPLRIGALRRAAADAKAREARRARDAAKPRMKSFAPLAPAPGSGETRDVELAASERRLRAATRPAATDAATRVLARTMVRDGAVALAASGGRETKRTTDDDDDDDDDDDAQLAAGPLDVLNPGPFALAGAPGRPGRLFVDLALPDPDFVFGDLGVRGSAARRRAAAAS